MKNKIQRRESTKKTMRESELTMQEQNEDSSDEEEEEDKVNIHEQ